jgi:hypothetical protein
LNFVRNKCLKLNALARTLAPSICGAPGSLEKMEMADRVKYVTNQLIIITGQRCGYWMMSFSM